MMPIEIASLATALVALVLSVLALARASAATEARAQLEAYLRAAQQTDIQVLFLRKAAGQYNFTLANRGASAARNINLSTLGDVPPAADPLANAGDRLPVPQLDPGGYFQIPVAVTGDMPAHFRLRVSWTNAGGLESVKEVALNLIA
jgi:hypothetical protein